jgi:dethiobiotin synthetase
VTGAAPGAEARRGPAWFVSGTDTEIGKTLASCALLHALRRQHARVVGAKPVAAGLDADGVNDDVRRLRAASTLSVAAALDNPYALPLPASPHLAAAAAGTRIELDRIAAAVDALRATADAVVVEGVGGFLVPLTDSLDGGDLAQRLALPVILVVGLRLGCLNHALLSAEAIAARGLTLAGWIGSAVDPAMALRDANVATLRARLRAPCLGVIPHLPQPDPARAALHLELPR